MVGKLRQIAEWAVAGATLLTVAVFVSYLAFLLARDLWSLSLSAWLRSLGGLLIVVVILLAGFLFAYILTRVLVWLRPTADEGSVFLVLCVIYVIGVGSVLGYDPNAHSHPLWTDLGFLMGGGILVLITGGLLWQSLDRPGRDLFIRWLQAIAHTDIRPR